MRSAIVTGLLVAAMVAGVRTAEADCGCGAWLLTEQVVTGKPYLVLESACANPGTPAKLSIVDAAGTSIAVSLVSTHDGAGDHVQLVFTPDRALAAGAYTVVHGDRYTSRLALRVVDAPATAVPPSWSGAPRVVAQNQVELGCGPAKTVEVEAGPDATLAFVELVDDTQQRRTGYVAVSKGTLKIGHGMCGGAFDLVAKRGYTAQVTLLAPARGTSSTSKAVSFTYAP